MIVFLEGKLSAAGAEWAVLAVSGMGFRVLVPLSTRCRLPDIGQPCRLETRLVWREDGPGLYGFATAPEAEVFDLLLRVSGVGPKLALSALSAATPAALLEALALQDVEALRRIPGIGRKTAERMVLELKDKVSLPAGAEDLRLSAGVGDPAAGPIGQAVQALQTLGYSRAEAVLAVEAVARDGGAPPDLGPEQLIRRALRYLAAK
ncbi:MAG: Holliday junction branch migration protein RuvA [Bacillota bacterium]|nr:Holliday junction branch migration protein RuvA [Bacillota bacterium]